MGESILLCVAQYARSTFHKVSHHSRTKYYDLVNRYATYSRSLFRSPLRGRVAFSRRRNREKIEGGKGRVSQRRNGERDRGRTRRKTREPRRDETRERATFERPRVQS